MQNHFNTNKAYDFDKEKLSFLSSINLINSPSKTLVFGSSKAYVPFFLFISYFPR